MPSEQNDDQKRPTIELYRSTFKLMAEHCQVAAMSNDESLALSNSI